MRAKLTSVGDEFAVVVDEELIARLGYTAGTVVDVRVEDGSIVIEPVRNPEPEDQSRPPARAPGA